MQQFKTLYTIAGAEEIIQQFIDKHYTSTLTGEDGKTIARTRNKRIMHKKVLYVLHLIWVGKLQDKVSTIRINKETLQGFFGEKGYHTSELLKWMREDGLLLKPSKHRHFKNRNGESATYCFGDTFPTKNFTTVQIPVDCAFMKRLLEREMKFKQYVEQEKQSQVIEPIDVVVVAADPTPVPTFETYEMSFTKQEPEPETEQVSKEFAFQLFATLKQPPSKIEKIINTHKSISSEKKEAILKWLPVYENEKVA